MPAISNLKDPTAAVAGLLLLVLGLSALMVRPTVAASLVAGATTNVSCIAHDSKFTCDCQHEDQHMTLPPLFGYVYQVEVRNCKALTIHGNALEGTQGLRKISFKQVDNLVLHQYALAFPRYASNTPLIVEFEQVNFELIDSHAINGNIEEITFIGGRIDVIQPFGFTTLKERAMLLKMENIVVRKIEPQAFKKFAVEQLEISNCIFESNVPSKAFYDLEVLNVLRISNVQFKEVHSRAFSFQMISKLSITNCHFQAADAEWLEAHIMDSASMRQNNFGLTSQISFKGLNVHRNYISSEPLELQFINNTVRFAYEPRPLDFNTRFRLNMKQLQYDQEYPCSNLDTTQKPPKPKTVFFQVYSDSIYFRRAPATGVSSVVDHQSFVALSKIIEWDCQQVSHLLYILLGVLVLVIILISVVLFMTVYTRRKKRKRRKMDVVLPEPRTYKETQIVYQIENAGLLKTDL